MCRRRLDAWGSGWRGPPRGARRQLSGRAHLARVGSEDRSHHQETERDHLNHFSKLAGGSLQGSDLSPPPACSPPVPQASWDNGRACGHRVVAAN